jgi:hypothetical protein
MDERLKRRLAIAAVLLGLAGLAYALFARPSEEERIRSVLDRLARAVSVEPAETNALLRAARLRKELGELLTDDVDVSIPELSASTRGRESVTAIAARAGSLYGSAEISLSAVDVKLDANETRASVRSIATLSAIQGNEAQRDRRVVRFGLVKQDGGWRVDSVAVAPRAEGGQE